MNNIKLKITVIKAGFIGAGGIARSHIFALSSLKYYYQDAPETRLVAVSTSTEKNRKDFAAAYGFEKSLPPDDFFKDPDIDTVYIFGPNRVHYEHLEKAVRMKSVKRVYIEKPLCSTLDEEEKTRKLVSENKHLKFQIGFQYLFMTPVREALKFWRSGALGKPVHFELKYFHGDYLQKAYRDKRTNRLTPAPDGGAMADLGSHVISILLAFLGNDLMTHGAIQSGDFPDVDRKSDLFSLVTLSDSKTGAAGTISASRIASGSGDLLSMDLYAENGSLHFTTRDPDYFEYFLEETGAHARVHTGSSFKGISSFPSGHVPPGWLRPMIHAHYIFLTESNNEACIPDIGHGLQVQRILRETAEKLRINSRL
ncbi:MAG TPA: Gfo/Idh/MocA family oxidoreductase [Bacteroidales bacterium]|nr:Gfo/Idh/MocA family oxidoreductase [Bacteroidales bacterium]